MSSSSFYSDSGITTAEADAVESSKNAAAQSAQDAQSHANTASNKADDANDSAIDAAASASTANNSNVAAVASNLGGTNTIGTVAGNIADVNTVAAMQSDVDTVANATYKGKVETVANATYKGKVETVAATDYKSDVETVAETTYKGKVETVADSTYKTKVEAVAADLAGSNTIGAAVQSATNAATSATNASTSETNAASSESTAATHASNASTHAITASGHKDSAEDAKTYAQAARDAAQGHRTQTGQDATAAAVSANSASSSASDAASSEANAAADALVASNSADSAKIDANVVKNISSTYGTLNAAINSASSSASQAASSASTASTHATTASGHASTAATHAANLGSVAYQNLTAIAESKAVTATDVFVYDTSKDSDGGAWRNRTQGTSWYNEALNTSTRGATKKFPAVAVIVAEMTKITIYDADDPSMPMWMVFQSGGYHGNGDFNAIAGNGAVITSVTARDGILYAGSDTTRCGLAIVEMIADISWSQNDLWLYNGNISQRNDRLHLSSSVSYAQSYLVNSHVNDIAVTVLPNAPIEPDTGLPVPTIAVATDGGVSVIKDDGSVVDISLWNNDAEATDVGFTYDNELLVHAWYSPTVDSRIYIYDIPDSDIAHGYYKEQYSGTSFLNGHGAASQSRSVVQALPYGKESIVAAVRKSIPHLLLAERHSDLKANITSSYNTGWMNGDIKLATLMDTTAETISAPELVTNGDFSSFGSELVDNGDFNTTSDWTFPNGGGSISNGQATVTATADTNVYIRQDLGSSLVSGKTYAVSFNVVAETGTGLAYVRLGGVDVATVGAYPQGVETHYITYTGGSPELRFMTYANSGAGFTIDDVSVKEVTGWEIPTTSNSTVEINNGALTGVRNSEDIVKQTLSTPLTAGETYNISFDITYISSNHWVYFNTNSQQITPTGASNTTPVGSYSHTFTATSNDTTLFLRAGGTAGLTFTIDNISLTKAEPDRSVSNNGLNIVGNITKEAVATGAELVGYKGWSSHSYLEQPFNADLDFGTGDWCIMGWMKTSDNYGHIFDRMAVGVGTGRLRLDTNNGALRFRGMGSSLLVAGSGFDDDNWHHFTYLRKDGVVKIFGDGVFLDSLAHTSDYTAPNAVTRIGVSVDDTGLLSGSLSLYRVSATAPTAEQIAKIYRDEKPLFQEGAKCTLSGKDDVQAIAYDEDTGKLHVGNGDATSGRYRDEFVGLQNVNPVFRDTYSIGTAISAVNGLVVEE